MFTQPNIASQDSSSISFLSDLHTGPQAWIEHLVQGSSKRYQGELEQDDSSDRGQDAPSCLWIIQHATTFSRADHYTPIGTGIGHDAQKDQTCLLVDSMRHFENRRD